MVFVQSGALYLMAGEKMVSGIATKASRAGLQLSAGDPLILTGILK
jgi:hypothetical protein